MAMAIITTSRIELGFVSVALLLTAQRHVQAASSYWQVVTPTGDYVTGVYDFDFVDRTYPPSFNNRSEDVAGRRLMARIWYPVCRKTLEFEFEFEFEVADATCRSGGGSGSGSGNSNNTFLGSRRLLFEEGEYEAIVQPWVDAMKQWGDWSIFKPPNNTTTFSYQNAPPLSMISTDGTDGTHGGEEVTAQVKTNGDHKPLLVFSHGGLGYVSQNTALLEELASHGYVVVSIAHPGGAAGVLYGDGSSVSFDNDYLQNIMVDLSFVDLGSPNITARYLAHKMRLEKNLGLAPYLPRWRDDAIAVVDYLVNMTTTTTATTTTTDPILGALPISASPQVVYIGHSYGGATSGSAAQTDDRAIGTINLDGTHYSLDLFNQSVRVPYLTLFTGLDNLQFFPNEFFFEPLTTMGQDDRVTRIRLHDIQHVELTDMALSNIEDRYEALYAMGGGRVDGLEIQSILATLCLEFLNYLTTTMTPPSQNDAITTSWSPETLAAKFPETDVFDVSYVAEWARTTTSSSAIMDAAETVDAQNDTGTSAEEADEPTLTDISACHVPSFTMAVILGIFTTGVACWV